MYFLFLQNNSVKYFQIAYTSMDCDEYLLRLCNFRSIAALIIFTIPQKVASDLGISLYQRFFFVPFLFFSALA